MLIIGDVHGKIPIYNEIIERSDCSLQIGDMGFDYSQLSHSRDHRFIGGNHDNYSHRHPNMLDDYGVWRDIFYIRGAYSIDRSSRTPGFNWFYEEELNLADCYRAFELYIKERPRIIVTHAPPVTAVLAMGKRLIETTTTSLLQACFEAHEPSIWVFGHMHESWSDCINRTTFHCLKELETFEV